MFDIKNPDTFLGGQNVHNLIIIGGLAFIGYMIWDCRSQMGKKFPK
jgi:hypothetical protein